MEAAAGRFLCGYLCGYVALWLCSYVAMWLYGYVAMWLCAYVDKFQSIISCFQVDIGPISKIFKKFLDGSSSFFGARLFQSLTNDLKSIYTKIICFKDVPIYF